MAASQLPEILTKVRPQKLDSNRPFSLDSPLNIVGDPTRLAAAGERDIRREDEEKVWWRHLVWHTEINIIWPLVQCSGVE